jgi:hypothetical protein
MFARSGAFSESKIVHFVIYNYRVMRATCCCCRHGALGPLEVDCAKPRPFVSHAWRIGALFYEMKAPWMEPRLRELVTLGTLAAFGCGLALALGDLLFAAIFGAASAVATIETIRRSRVR